MLFFEMRDIFISFLRKKSCYNECKTCLQFLKTVFTQLLIENKKV